MWIVVGSSAVTACHGEKSATAFGFILLFFERLMIDCRVSL
jgi:hypothetical protein